MVKIVSDIAIFVLDRDIKYQLTNLWLKWHKDMGVACVMQLDSDSVHQSVMSKTLSSLPKLHSNISQISTGSGIPIGQSMVSFEQESL